MPGWNQWVDDEQVSLMHSLITLEKIKEEIVGVAKEIDNIKSFELLPPKTKKLLTELYQLLAVVERDIVETHNPQAKKLRLLNKFDEVMTSLLANERQHPQEPP